MAAPSFIFNINERNPIMCGPAAAMLAITAISTMAQYSAQNSAAKRQAEGARKQGEQEQMDLARQADQQAEAGAAQANEHARAAARDAALFETVAGEYGGGNSIDRAGAVANIQRNEQLATLNRNAELASQENRFAVLATRQNTNARLASIQYPSKVGAALSIAGAAANAYGATRGGGQSPSTDRYSGPLAILKTNRGSGD